MKFRIMVVLLFSVLLSGRYSQAEELNEFVKKLLASTSRLSDIQGNSAKIRIRSNVEIDNQTLKKKMQDESYRNALMNLLHLKSMAAQLNAGVKKEDVQKQWMKLADAVTDRKQIAGLSNRAVSKILKRIHKNESEENWSKFIIGYLDVIPKNMQELLDPILFTPKCTAYFHWGTDVDLGNCLDAQLKAEKINGQAKKNFLPANAKYFQGLYLIQLQRADVIRWSINQVKRDQATMQAMAAIVERIEGKYDNALTRIDQTLNAKLKLSEDLQGLLYYEKALNLYFKKDFKQSRNFAQKAKDVAKKREFKSRAHRLLLNLEIAEKNWDRALGILGASERYPAQENHNYSLNLDALECLIKKIHTKSAVPACAGIAKKYQERQDKVGIPNRILQIYAGIMEVCSRPTITGDDRAKLQKAITELQSPSLMEDQIIILVKSVLL